MSPTDSSPVSAEPARSRFRLPHWGWFLLVTVVLAFGFVGLSIWLPYHREQQIVQEIESWGGGVDTGAVEPEWLRHLVGEDRIKKFKVFDRIISVRLSRTTITDAEIAHLSGLTNLRYLWLSKTAVTDAALVHLSGCTNLESLGLSESVTDEGLTHLRGLTNLRRLGLNRTAVTDSGLTRLIGLKNLETLWIDDTAVTENGIEELQNALPKCEIRR